MKFTRTVSILLASSMATACSQEYASRSDVEQLGEVEYVESPEAGLPANPSKRRLPSSVKIVSDKEKDFGINLAALTLDQVSDLLD
jgi:hypothetical protein